MWGEWHCETEKRPSHSFAKDYQESKLKMEFTYSAEGCRRLKYTLLFNGALEEELVQSVRCENFNELLYRESCKSDPFCSFKLLKLPALNL